MLIVPAVQRVGLILGLPLVAVASSLSAAAPTRAAAAASTVLVGRVSDALGDGPAGADLDSLRVGYDGAQGLLTATVTLHGASLASGTIVFVTYGSTDQSGRCDDSSGPAVTFDAGEDGATWSLGDRAAPGPLITRLAPTPTTTMSSGIASAALRGRAITCAVATTLSSPGPAALDTSPVAELVPAASIVSPMTSDPTTLELDYSYDAPLATRDGEAAVRVVCLAASTGVCHGRLVLKQQSTHVAIGAARVSVALGRPSTVRVPIRLTRAMRSRPVVIAVATLESSPGRVAIGALRLRR
jgi:hypothetical protein